VATLALGGAFAGALVANVYQRTLPAIQRYADARIEGAVHEVLAAPARLDTLYLIGEVLSRTPPAGVELREVTKAFVGFDDRGARTGVAVEAAAPGFADQVRLMVGFNPATSALTGYAMLGQKETPGLGDKIEKDTLFVAQFRGKVAPLSGTKNSTTSASMVHTITGATISSRAVIQIINNAVALWQPRLAAFDHEGNR
jgi:electron transport complex protein RnfG